MFVIHHARFLAWDKACTALPKEFRTIILMLESWRFAGEDAISATPASSETSGVLARACDDSSAFTNNFAEIA